MGFMIITLIAIRVSPVMEALSVKILYQNVCPTGTTMQPLTLMGVYVVPGLADHTVSHLTAVLQHVVDMEV
jgi:hypothetical protein